MFGLDEPRQQKHAVVVLLFIAAIVMFYQFRWAPLRAERNEVTEHLELLEHTNTRARAITQPDRVAELERRENDYREAMAAYDAILPDAAAVPLLLAQVSSAALSEGVEIVQFTPLEASGDEDLVEFPFDLEVQGRYHSVGRFLAGVVNLPRVVRPRIMSLRGVTIDPVDEFDEPRHEVVASILLSAYARPARLQGEVVEGTADAGAGDGEASDAS